MYTKEQASRIKQEFWTRFGRYMQPVLSSEGEKVNWINYNTGVAQVYFRMDATKDAAFIAIEITHKDGELAEKLYRQFLLLQPMLEQATGEEWDWEPLWEDQHGKTAGRIWKQQAPLNIFKESDWPAIISFLKPRMIALDAFWNDYKMVFEMIA